MRKLGWPDYGSLVTAIPLIVCTFRCLFIIYKGLFSYNLRKFMGYIT